MDKKESYKETKEFICTGCGKSIILTKFASQKTCRCDECKENDIPINPDIVSQALAKNPPKQRHIAKSTGKTKECQCVKCGNMVTVSKFMSASKVLCQDCKGNSTNIKYTRDNAPRLNVDASKIDRSKLLPIIEYEVNDVVIANRRLAKVKCPACGHEHMTPLSIADWSQFGLIIQYQCPECLLVMTISEQTKRKLNRHTPAERFDYTGRQIKELGISSVEHSRLSNIIRILIKKLEDNNINIEDIDDIEYPPYKWQNEKPVPIGFKIPDEDIWIDTIDKICKLIEGADHTETNIEIPKGSADILVNKLREILKGDNEDGGK